MKDGSKMMMKALIPKNFHLWVKEFQEIAKKNKIWVYVDSEGTTPESEEGAYPDISKYQVPMPTSNAAATGLAAAADERTRNTFSLAGVAAQISVIRPTMFADELNDRQRAAYQLDIQTFKLRQQHAEKMISKIRIVDNAIKNSVKMYIFDDKMTATMKETIQALAEKYKRTKNQIIEQFHIQFQFLKNTFAKDKIKQWMVDWENMRNLIINNESTELFDSKIIFIDEFLRAGRK